MTGLTITVLRYPPGTSQEPDRASLVSFIFDQLAHRPLTVGEHHRPRPPRPGSLFSAYDPNRYRTRRPDPTSRLGTANGTTRSPRNSAENPATNLKPDSYRGKRPRTCKYHSAHTLGALTRLTVSFDRGSVPSGMEKLSTRSQRRERCVRDQRIKAIGATSQVPEKTRRQICAEPTSKTSGNLSTS